MLDQVAEAIPAGGARFETIARIPMNVQVVLGSTSMVVADLMALRRGAIVTLDRRIGEPVDIVVNGRIVARGDLRVVDDDDGRFGIAITEIVGDSDSAGAAHVG